MSCTYSHWKNYVRNKKKRHILLSKLNFYLILISCTPQNWKSTPAELLSFHRLLVVHYREHGNLCDTGHPGACSSLAQRLSRFVFTEASLQCPYLLQAASAEQEVILHTHFSKSSQYILKHHLPYLRWNKLRWTHHCSKNSSDLSQSVQGNSHTLEWKGTGPETFTVISSQTHFTRSYFKSKQAKADDF